MIPLLSSRFLRYRIALSFGFFLSWGSLSSLFSQSLYFRPQAREGGHVTVLAYPFTHPVRSISASLRSPSGKKISSNSGASFDILANFKGKKQEKRAFSAFFVLGIPIGTAPGNYTVSVNLQAGGKKISLKAPLRISGRKLASEQIPLSTAVSSVRRSKSPRKKEQSRELWALISRKEPSKIYQTRAFSLPLPKKDMIQSGGFGDRREFVYTDTAKKSASIHWGIDWAAPTGTPVYASGDGEVMMSRKRISTGNTVIIRHFPGVFSLYYHLNRLKVKKGDIVKQGALIGTLGQTGIATGPHLHFEIRIGSVPSDPMQFIREDILDKAAVLDMIEKNKKKGR